MATSPRATGSTMATMDGTSTAGGVCCEKSMAAARGLGRQFRRDAEAPRPGADRVGAGLHRLVEHTEQLLLVEHHLLAAQPGEVEQRGQLDGVHRAGLLAHAAVDAAQLVDDERLGVLLAVAPLLRGRR